MASVVVLEAVDTQRDNSGTAPMAGVGEVLGEGDLSRSTVAAMAVTRVSWKRCEAKRCDLDEPVFLDIAFGMQPPLDSQPRYTRSTRFVNGYWNVATPAEPCKCRVGFVRGCVRR